MSSTAETDAEDVNDFLKRVQELGTKRDQEDEERNKKLEEEILQGRKERQARRAERARSISPLKDSPTNTPLSYKSTAVSSPNQLPKTTLTPSHELRPPSQSSNHEELPNDAMERVTGDGSRPKDNTPSTSDQNGDPPEKGFTRTDNVRASPSNAMPSRSSTLSWQRRPNSQASDRSKARPLSMIAGENATRSPRRMPESPPLEDDTTPMGRNEIAQSLASKDPTWFRQTSDRGQSSAAYRKTQVEDKNVAEVSSPTSRMQLPGMSRSLTYGHNDSCDSEGKDIDRSSSPSRNSSSNGSAALTGFSGSASGQTGLGSPMPTTNAQWLAHAGSTISSDGNRDQSSSTRGLAMSPSQGRISPERMDRPTSPTKGMGGFVQSAMMKRSDSVNKRWSVQSPGGLSRRNSVTSNHSGQDLTSSIPFNNMLNSSAREARPSSLSQENTLSSILRPSSSHSNSTIIPENDRPSTPNSLRGSLPRGVRDEEFAKPGLPASLSHTTSNQQIDQPESFPRSETPPPPSPSKALDTRRWSPTKSSWLENALNKPDSPKLKPVASPQQPSWMSELNKAKQRTPAETSSNPTVTHKHQVSIGGLLRSPPMGGVARPLSIGGLPAGFSSVSLPKSQPTKVSEAASITKAGICDNASEETIKTLEARKSQRPETPKSSTSLGLNPSSPIIGKIKPETPPKKDFRSNLKPKQLPSEKDDKGEPEFKNVFGQLRRTKTQNYVAPDELKGNILRGKAGLNMTSGPKQTERKDEFKEAILKKKEGFKKSQLEGTGVTKAIAAQPEVQLPEALLKRRSLGRSNTLVSGARNNDVYVKDSSGIPSGNDLTSDTTNPKPQPQETSAPGRLQGKLVPGGKLAERFNPALSGLLARGLPSMSTERTANPSSGLVATSPRSAVKEVEQQDSGPQLSHMTKSRARGPRRKAPSATSAVTSESTTVVQPAHASKSSPNDFQHTDGSSGEKMFAGFLDKVDAETPTGPITTNESDSQPSSPHKLDLKRRSKFFEEIPSNNNDNTIQPLQIRKMTSPTSTVNIDRTSKEVYGSSYSEPKFTPTTNPKPSALSTSPALDSNKFRASDKSNEAPRNIQKPLQYALEGVDDDKVSSVRETKTLFDRSVLLQTKSDNVQSSPTVKPLFKLPTQLDENAAMVDEDLRTLRSDSQSSGIEARDTSGYNKSATVHKQPFQSSRPLPTPPLKISRTPTPEAVKPLSPRKNSSGLTSQSAEASKTLTDFFNTTASPEGFSVDTAALIARKPDLTSKIESLKAQIYQLSNDGKKQAVPKGQERVLFEGNVYICTHTFTTQTGKRLNEVYFWVGDDVSESAVQDAEFFAQREARIAGGKLIKLRQGNETTELVDALGGILVIHRGPSHRFDSLAPHMLCARQHAGRIIFDEVDFAPSSLCSGFPYIISTQSGKCYLWKGKGSGVDELSSARLVGMEYGLTGYIEEVEDGKEPSSFLNIFGDSANILKSADHWRLKPNYGKYCSRLFVSDPESSSKITEITPFSQASMSPSHIYILDAFFEIYIIVGAQSQSQYAAFCTALLFAQDYGILSAGMEDRPFVPVSTVVMEGVPRDLKFVFRKWRDSICPTIMHVPAPGLRRGRSLRVVPLTAALDATRL